MCSWDRDWLDLVLGCMVVGPPGLTTTIGIFGIGGFVLVLEWERCIWNVSRDSFYHLSPCITMRKTALDFDGGGKREKFLAATS